MSSSYPKTHIRHERIILASLASVQFTHIMDFMIMMPLGSHLMRVFAISPQQFTYLVAAYGIAAAVTGFLAGFVMDRFDRKTALLTLYAGFTLSTLGCALAPTYYALLIARLAAGAFGGVAGSVVGAIVGDVVPLERRGRGMGVVMSAFPLASILGVPVGLWLAERYAWHAPFFMLSILCVIIWILAALSLPALPRRHALVHPWTQMANILGHPVHQRALLMSGFLVFAGGCIIPFMAPSMVSNVGLSERQLPLIYLAGGAATFFTTPLFGKLSDQHDKLHVLAWLSLLASVTVLVVTRLSNVPVFVALVVTTLFMVSMAGRFIPAMAMLTNAVEERYRGGFMSVNSAVQQAASGIANITAGVLVFKGSDDRLIGYSKVGWLAVICFAMTVVLASMLRTAAPHSSRVPQIPRPVAT